MRYNKDKKEIIIDKEPSNLDKFALDFLKILEKYVSYVIVAGYVSILLGRTRVTEDIDVFIKKMSREEFSKLYIELRKNNFWCLNAEKAEEIFLYLQDGFGVRFSKENSPIPNFEVKFPKDSLDEEVFNDNIKVILTEGNIIISSLERHIAFKEEFLGSNKDKEDAKHIKELFKEYLNKEKINKIKMLIKNRKNERKKKIHEAWKN
ncbi:MAG: hypothetical protein AABX30_00695 [Nanoarchaeota archaeon]